MIKNMFALKLKTVDDAISKRDGLRIYVSRYRLRYLKKEFYDVWMPSLAPSEMLLKDLRRNNITWKQFVTLYKAQITSSKSEDTLNPRMKNKGQKYTLRLLKLLSKNMTITLMCSCTEFEHCHARILKEMIEKI